MISTKEEHRMNCVTSPLCRFSVMVPTLLCVVSSARALKHATHYSLSSLEKKNKLLNKGLLLYLFEIYQI